MQLLEWSPGDVPLDLQLGFLYKTFGQALDKAGQRAEADRHLDLALALFERVARQKNITIGERAGALNGLGNLFYERGDPDNAARTYRRVLELAPDYAYAWHDLLGALLFQAQRGKADVPSMEHALERLKATGAGIPGLGARHIAQLEGMVGAWARADTHETRKQKGGTAAKTSKPKRRA
jgi:tetratricopeptide (TPR) repeat protein